MASVPRIGLCYVCGFSEDEVAKLHYFPSQLERSKMWQESMGMCYTGESCRNYRICSRHFTDESYVDLISRRLSRNAVPILFPCTPSTCLVQEGLGEGIASTSKIEPHALEEFPTTVLGDIVSTPVSEHTSTPIRKRSVFRDIDNLSKSTANPRKLKLINLVCRKEDHIRKLKLMCKQKAHNIKSLSDLSDSSVLRDIFRRMSNTTADFIISQLRCAKRNPKGRRWTVEEKVVALALLKRSPKCYRLLSKIVAMPSKRTLLSLLEKVPFHIGINYHLFKHISNCLKNEQVKLCVLLFDEMDIKETLMWK